MDQELRNKLRNVVTQCRRLLEDECRQALEGKFGIFTRKDQVTADPNAKMAHLGDEERAARKDILDHYEHIKARGFKPKDALDQLVREIAFTHLNRLCAYKMMEAREVYVGGRRFREAVSRGINSNGLKFYLADHEEDERLYNTGHQEVAYRHFLDWLGGLLSEEIGVLFNPNDPANRLYPQRGTLDAVLDLLNGGGIKPEETALRERWPQIWSQDETIGWVYQYFTPKELRDQARKASQAPRNSYELAFRNQFFTPRYVVEFLTDNTLGRIWYEMRQGRTRLAEQCRYLVRQPDEVFFARMTSPDEEFPDTGTIEAARLLREGTEETFPPFEAGDDSTQRMIEMAHTVSAYDRHGDEAFTLWNCEDGPRQAERLGELTTQQILDWLFMTCRADRHGGRGEVYSEPWFVAMANEMRRRALAARNPDLTAEERLKLPVFIPYRAKKDPREIKLLDPACGSGHFLLYGFDLLLVIYEEAYSDPDLGPALQRDYPTLDALRRDVPRLILAHNLHGIDIDLRATQIAALALWLRCQRAYQEMELKKDRPRISRSNFVCAEPMPGEQVMLREFIDQLEPKLLGQLVEEVFAKMELAGEAGSLLKIDEEIQETVTKARRQWVTGPVATQRRLFDNDEPAIEQRRFDFSGITDTQFFEQAEARVVDALRSYAERAQKGQQLQRRLFAEDALRGFAFVDLCHKLFDVILMNPPFGEPTVSTLSFLRNRYPQAADNVLVAFVLRFFFKLRPQGRLGAITDRSFVNKRVYETFRSQFIADRSSMSIFLDLGWNVLDANVEVAAHVHADSSNRCWAASLTRHEDKETELLKITSQSSYAPYAIQDFQAFPGFAFAFDLDEALSRTFSRGIELGKTAFTSFGGLKAGNADHLFRLAWEVRPEDIGPDRKWALFQNGSPFSPYYYPCFLVVMCDSSSWSTVLSYESSRITNNEHYFKPGVSYGKRTDYMYGYKVRSQQVPSMEGHLVLPCAESNAWQTLGIINSSPYQEIVNYLCGQHKYAGYVNPAHLEIGLYPDVAETVRKLVRQLEMMDTGNETSNVFVSPSSLALPYKGETAVELMGRAVEHRKRACDEANSFRAQLNGTVQRNLGWVPRTGGATATVDYVRNLFGQSDSMRLEASGVLSYFLGVAFGRWDIRYCLRSTSLDLGDDFAPPSHYQPGLLVDSSLHPAQNGMIASEKWVHARKSIVDLAEESRIAIHHDAPKLYEISVAWEGIIPDDPEHPNDALKKLAESFELLFDGQSGSMERGLLKLLSYADFRGYLRSLGKDGFWEDHLSRYSKGRRKAPIYWLLQSSKKNYALWIYYHRLDKDILFKALTNFVEPKLRLEAERLQALTTQKAQAGDSGKEAKRLAKEVEKQEDFLSELRDFEDKLRRAANLNLEPDLNDGVVLNIAPLWELVPWKEAKAYWQELLEGKYEWSSIGKQLREKGLVK